MHGYFRPTLYMQEVLTCLYYVPTTSAENSVHLLLLVAAVEGIGHLR